MTRTAAFLVALTVVAVAPSAAAQETTAAAPAAKTPSAAAVAAPRTPPDYVIGSGDVLEVLFWRDKELSAEVIVRPDGKITLPLLNEVNAAGLTPDELRLTITDQALRFVEEPRAVVRVKEINSRKVFITGEVAKAGTYPLVGPTSVLQLIATAGGVSEFADRGGIVILRSVAGRQERYRFNYDAVLKGKNLKQNIELKAGDTVVVP
jgi:polysaccharide export outer membrane protein